MSNRTKIKKRPLKENASAPLPEPPKKLWQPPQTLLAAVIFLALGAAILGKSIYIVIPAGVVLIALLGWSGLAVHYSGAGSRAFRSMLMPSILVVILIVVRVFTLLGK